MMLINRIKTVDQMKDKLLCAGNELDSNVLAYKVEDIYNVYIHHQSLKNAEDGDKSVVFPLLPPSTLDSYKGINVDTDDESTPDMKGVKHNMCW